MFVHQASVLVYKRPLPFLLFLQLDFQSELKMAGFRSLEEGERVAFYVRSRNNGLREGALEAWQVVHLSFCAVFTAFLLLFVLVAIVVKT